MKVTNSTKTSSLDFFSRLGQGKPFVMVNLLNFKPDATYDDKSHPPCSGEEAFRRYLDAVKDKLQEKGGKILQYGEVFGLLIGEVEDLWDYVLIVQYPSLEIFQELISSDLFGQAQVHRRAGLAGQLNIATKVSLQL